MDGRDAENAGAFFRRAAMDGGHAENAGAFFGGGLGAQKPKRRKSM
jgi:hypothetical protein